MGMIYRRKKRDPTTGTLAEQGPYWMKYYVEGRPFQESTRTSDKDRAKRILKIKEGEIAAGLYRGPNIDRTRYECVFQPKPATDSDASRPPIPTERGH